VNTALRDFFRVKQGRTYGAADFLVGSPSPDPSERLRASRLGYIVTRLRRFDRHLGATLQARQARISAILNSGAAKTYHDMAGRTIEYAILEVQPAIP